MPFERYLRVDEDDSVTYDHGSSSSSSSSQFNHPAALNAIQFQIPHFMLNGPPILAPGGGAEVLPAGLLDSPDSLASSWLTNSGFAPFHSAARHQQADSEPTSSIAFDLLTYGPDDDHVSHTPFPPAPAPLFTENHHPVPVQSDQVSPPSTYQSHLQPALSYSFLVPPLLSPPPTAPLPMSSALALPVYSTSGFDLLSILGRVANRPYPIVNLGPVDLSCSFAIADVRRHDSPIVYASPSFYRLTGYSEQEVIGRNCRFLQSPTGHVARGEVRQSVLRDTVAYMRKALASGKECQASLVNYRKGGQPFINLVTVIPLRGGVHGRSNEADDIVYHVGFQVDLTEQPRRILDQLRNGSYCTTYGTWTSPGIPDSLATPQQMTGAGALVLPPRSSKTSHLIGGAVSRDLRNLITDNTFADAVPISTSVNISGTVAPDPGGTTTPLSSLSAPASNSVPITIPSSSTILTGAPSSPLAPISPALSLLLLELLPDFLLVLSLKGSFLYVAPSVRLVLGYEPHELVGRSIADVCHPADLVPLMRELKEGSVSAGGTLGSSGSVATCPPGSPGDGAHPLGVPKPVDLLFRAAPKTTVHPLPPFSSSTSAPALTTNTATAVASDIPTQSSASDTESTSRPYIWLECRGRLHVEPGKGRKAIILSGRARWMPTVRWDTIKRVGGVGVGILGASSSPEPNPQAVPAGQGSKAVSLAEPQEFWALLAPAGTFLVASAGVRDVLGWGVGEIIGRSLWGMVADGMAPGVAIRAQVERELARLSEEEVIAETGNPKPTVLSVTLVTRSGHTVPVRIVFYPTPRAHTHLPTGGLANPRGNPLCPLVCQVSVLPPGALTGMVSVSSSSCPSSSRDAAVSSGDAGPWLMHPGDAALFEELDTARGSSWQYELQQLKFANQRLHEELETLEGTSTDVLATESVTADNSTSSAPSVPTSMSELAAPMQPSPMNQLHTEVPYQSLFPSKSSIGTLSHPHPTAQASEHPRAHASGIIDWSSIVSHGLSVPLKRAWNSDDRAI